MTQHTAIADPAAPGRYLVCSVGPAGVLTAVEDCASLEAAQRRARERDAGQVEVHLPAPQLARRTKAAFYTDADAA